MSWIEAVYAPKFPRSEVFQLTKEDVDSIAEARRPLLPGPLVPLPFSDAERNESRTQAKPCPCRDCFCGKKFIEKTALGEARGGLLRAQQDYEELHQQYAQDKIKIFQLQRTIASFQDQIQVLKEESEVLRQKIASDDQALHMLKTSEERLRQKLRRLGERYTLALQQTKDQYSAQMTSLVQEVAVAQTACAEARAREAARGTTLAAAVSRLQAHLPPRGLEFETGQAFG
jgi:hypothetical protein